MDDPKQATTEDAEQSAAAKIGAGLGNKAAAASTAKSTANNAGESPAQTDATQENVEKHGGGKATAEHKELRERLAKLESERTEFESKLLAKSTVDGFIREKMSDLPYEMAQRFLPETSDKEQLAKAEQQIRGWVKQIFDRWVKAGDIVYTRNTIKSDVGGISPGVGKFDAHRDPVGAIASGLSVPQNKRGERF